MPDEPKYRPKYFGTVWSIREHCFKARVEANGKFRLYGSFENPADAEKLFHKLTAKTQDPRMDDTE